MTNGYVYIFSISQQRSIFTVQHELTDEQASKIAHVLADGDDIDSNGLVYLHATIEDGQYTLVTD